MLIFIHGKTVELIPFMLIFLQNLSLSDVVNIVPDAFVYDCTTQKTTAI